ncbi:MAG: GTP cyclohydrolase I FolE, partial [Aeromonas sp.]
MTTLSPQALLVRAALEAQGLETPLVTNALNSQQKREKIEGHMRAIMETLGLDLTDDSLAET